MRLCGPELLSHRDMASLLISSTPRIQCRSLSGLSDKLAAPTFSISRSPFSPIERLDRPDRFRSSGREQLRGDNMEVKTHFTNKNMALARLQLILTDDALRGELNPESCSSLLLECASSCSAGSWPLLWKCYNNTVSLFGGVSEAASEALWRSAIRTTYVSHAVEIFKGMVSPALRPNEAVRIQVIQQRKYCGIISQLLKVRGRGLGNKQLAYGLWREIYESAKTSKRYPIDLGGLDVVTCRTGLNACIECGRIREARDLLSEMREAQIHPGHGSYNILIKFYSQRGDMEGAIKAMHEMQSVGLSPDLFTFNTLISGYARKGDVDMAKVVLDRAVEQGLRPDVHTYSAYLHALAKKGDRLSARGIIDSMWLSSAPSQPNAWSYSALIEAHLNGDDLSGAEEAFEQMKLRGLPYSSAVGNLLIQNYLKQGSSGVEKALRVLSGMISEGIEVRADSYCLFMDHHAISGEEGADHEVMKLLNKIRDLRIAPDSVQLSIMAKVLVRIGRSSDALDVASEIDGCDNAGGGDLVAMNQAVYLLCQSGNMGKAEVAADRAVSFALSSSLPPPVEAYGALIRGYYKRKELGPLVTAFRKFLSLGGIPHRSMANAVVRLCLLKGDNTTALQAIRAMKLLGVDLDPERYRLWVMQVQKRAEEWKRRVDALEMRKAQEADRLQETRNYQGDQEEEGDVSDGQPSRVFNDRLIRESQVGLERLKWFLGLPNNYYKSEFRD